MEKQIAASLKRKQATLSERIRKFAGKMEHLSPEACFEMLTVIMYRLILFLGIPYFIYVLFSFIRMTS